MELEAALVELEVAVAEGFEVALEVEVELEVDRG